jgi:hypothetical protein
MLRRSRQEGGVDLYTEIEGIQRRHVSSIWAILDQDKPYIQSESRAFVHTLSISSVLKNGKLTWEPRREHRDTIKVFERAQPSMYDILWPFLTYRQFATFEVRGVGCVQRADAERHIRSAHTHFEPASSSMYAAPESLVHIYWYRFFGGVKSQVETKTEQPRHEFFECRFWKTTASHILISNIFDSWVEGCQNLERRV